MNKSRIAGTLLLALAVAGCSYSLPAPVQRQVDSISAQADNVYKAVRAARAAEKDGKIDDTTLRNVRSKYNELVRAHDDWRDEVRNVISKEMENFENDDQYRNKVRQLENASAEFEKAADAALGTPSDVPDWSVETRELIELAYSERKLKQAADIVYDDLRMSRWDEIK
jgi:PBP1b-binding outer membrane lipoprotein LpoB